MEKKKKSYDTQDKKYKQYIEEKINEFNSNGKKTIVHFCDTYYPIIDGVIKVLENYASRLSKTYNVVVVVPKHKNKVIVPSNNYLVIGSNSMYFKFVNYDLAFPDGDTYVSNVLKKLKISLIHSHSPFNMGTYAAKLAKKLKIPLVMTMHSQYRQDFLKYTKNEGISNALVKSISKVFNKSTEVWTMHDKVAEELKSYGYKGKFYYVPNATDYKIPENPESYNEIINKKYNLTPNDNVFLFVGRLVEQKNIFFIVDALNNLKEMGINFKMFFVGNGPDEIELKRRIKKYELNNDIILTGKIESREELAMYYQRSNLFLFPSVYDTSSLVQIEAATYKTPGVFIEGTATAKTITNNRNGFLSTEDPNTFAQTIANAIKDKEKLKQISENAFNELYVSWDMVVEKVSARYEYLIEQNLNKNRKLEIVKQTLKK